jgi:hypothetical protein
MVSRALFPSQILASVKTDASGNYSVTGLPAGIYQVQFTKTGFDNAVMQSYIFLDKATEQLNAQMVPLLTATEIPQRDEKKEVTFTVTNPNSFSVSYHWMFPTRGLQGSAVAPPGNSVLDTVTPPHTESIELSVDSVLVQPARPSDVPPPVFIGDLTGYVDSSSNAPLTGVEVTLTNILGCGLPATTYTLSDGSYVFHNEPAGIYKLTYTRTGYYTASQDVFLPFGSVQVLTEFLRPVPPPPTANVTVKVVDSSHNPTANVNVTISYSGGATYQQTTNGNGAAQFTNQPTGVAATIVATTTDGSGRTATANSSGFVVGNNTITVTLPTIQTGSISGTVTNASNASLAGVDVVVLNASNAVVTSALTGAGGTYNITGLTAGTYSMTFSLASYVTSAVGGVAVTPGGTTAESVSLVTVSSTQAAVMVTVTDAGVPAVGASVSIAYSNGTTSTTVTTNSMGVATFSGQPAGVVGTVTAEAGDGTGRSVSSTPQAFPAQTTTNISLAIPPINNAMISGTITDANLGNAVSGVVVTVTDSHGNVVGTTTSTPSGYSVGGLGLQTYTLTFTNNNYLTYANQVSANSTYNVSLAPLSATANVQVSDNFGNGISGATVTLTYPGYNLISTGTTNASGSVSIASQPAAVSAAVSVLTTDGRTASTGQVFASGSNSVYLTVNSDYGAIDGEVIDSSTNSSLINATVTVIDFNNNVVATTTTNLAGQYLVQNLIPGTYTFTFSDTGYQTLSLTVAVTAAATMGANAALVPQPGSVQGTVVGSISQSPVPGAQITLSGPASISATTDSNGNFNIGAAPPGTYTGTLVGGIFSQAINITIVSNQSTTVNLVLDTSSIAGKVVDQNGTTLGGVQVTLTGGGFASYTVTTDQNGNYVANRESNTGNMTLTAVYNDPGVGQWTGTEQISVASDPPEQVVSPIVVNVPASLATAVTLNGVAVSGAQVTIAYQTGQFVGPNLTDGTGTATFNTLILADSATVSAYYVDGTGTVWFGTSPSQTFNPGTNSAAIQLSPAHNAQSAHVSIAVTDQSGNPLTGASVTLTYSGGATSAVQTTDSSGNVIFTSQQSGVGVTINVTYTDSMGNTKTGSQTLASGFVNGNNFYAVAVS